jgi:hypothetical protein
MSRWYKLTSRDARRRQSSSTRPSQPWSRPQPFRRGPRVAAQNNDVAPSLSWLVTTLRLAEPRHPLDEQVEVAGETYHIKAIRRVYEDQAMPISAPGQHT